MSGNTGDMDLGLQEKALIEKIRSLPPEEVAKVLDFVDLLSHWRTDAKLVKAVQALSEPRFAEIWDNPEDEVHDRIGFRRTLK